LINLPRVWLADLTYTQQTIAADTIPMAIGCIAEYLEKSITGIPEVSLFKYPEALIKALSSEIPEVLGFSNYVWNYQLSKEIAKHVKSLSPRTVVIFGGPNYPIDNQGRKHFLEENYDIFDYYVVGEGELAFSNLLGCLIDSNFSREKVFEIAPPSVHFMHGDKIVLTSKVDRLTELDVIPSPYTSGKLDEFFDGKLMPLLQTNRGCPFSCTFCVEGDDYYTKIRKYNRSRIDEDVHYIGNKIAETAKSHSRRDLFIADSNFGMYPSDVDTARALAETKEKYAWPDYINVATGKNAKERVIETARLLDGSLRLSGSVQSLDPEVLGNIKRKNISPEQLVDLGLHTKTIGVNSYSEIILGLPGDSKIKHFKTIASVMDAGFNIILPWQLMLIHGSELATPRDRETYGLQTKFRVLPRCYGRWEFARQDGTTGSITSVEIEEVSVSSDTLSFNDYIDCRVLNYFVATYYNDALFTPVISFLNTLGVRSFDFICTLMDVAQTTNYQKIVDSFIADTKDELWDSRDELHKFVMSSGNIEKYINGDLGKNILFFHRAKAYCTHIEEMRTLMHEAYKRILDEVVPGEKVAYGAELIDYCATLADGVLDTRFEVLEKSFSYNFQEHIASNNFDTSSLSKKPFKYRFEFSDETKSLVQRSISTHGSDLVGFARILSRIFVKKLYRKAIPITDSLR
jgi:radical SAM superfamily enzyme YgiQ (UPF0313 family)